MYVILILTVDTKKIELYNVFNDRTVAQNELTNAATKIANELDNSIIILSSQYEILVYNNSIGYITSAKTLVKICSLHEFAKYEAMEIEQVD